MRRIAGFLRSLAMPLLVIGLCGFIAYDHLIRPPAGRPVPSPSIDGRALGRAYAPALASSLAEGWIAAAAAIEAGKPVPEAQAALQATWKNARSKMFAAQVAPAFGRVLPEGSEPADPAQRAAVARLWRDFAAGLKGGR